MVATLPLGGSLYSDDSSCNLIILGDAPENYKKKFRSVKNIKKLLPYNKGVKV